MILKTIAFSLLWIATLTSIVLCVSSLVERKTLALVGIFAFVFLTEASANVLAELTNRGSYRLLSLTANFERVADWLFDQRARHPWDVEASAWALGGLLTVALVTIAHRVRRMEVVA